MLLQISSIVVGFALLIKGAEWMVDGAAMLARNKGVSDLAIGLTIVAFGTSAPELVVNSFASFQDYPDIVFGNVIGSNNFNLFITLGLVGLISPLVVQSSTVWKEIPLSFAVVVVMYLQCNEFTSRELPALSRADGLLLLIIFGLFLLYVHTQLKMESTTSNVTTAIFSNSKIWSLILGGLLCLVVGGKLVVTNAVEIATELHVSEKIIGLTIVAAGTSLPELVTSMVAAARRNRDIAIGNIIGSNIFNFLLIFPISSFIRPISYSTVFNKDVYLLGAGSILLFVAMFTGKRKKLDRWEAAILLIGYIIYTIYLIRGETQSRIYLKQGVSLN